MKNVINIDATNSGTCDLLSNVNDGTNSLFVQIKSDLSLNPRLEIAGQTIAIETEDFISGITPTLYTGTGNLQFRIVDDSHTGDYFNIAKISSIPDGSNLTLKQTDNFNYSLSIGSKNNELLNTIYPVGAIYMSVNNVSPATFIGGTWEQIKDRFLLSAGSSYAAGATGGEASHALSTDEMPNHAHSVGAHSHGLNSHTHTTPNHTHTITVANGGSHSHTFAYNQNMATGSSVGSPHSAGYSGTGDITTSTHSGHSHTLNQTSSGSGTTGEASGSTANSTAFNSGSAGGSEAHNNMPPYLAVYMWKRTA